MRASAGLFIFAAAILGPSLASAQLSPQDQIRANEQMLVQAQQQQQIDALREQIRTDQQNLQSQQNIAILKAQGNQSPVNPGLVPIQPSPYLSYSRPPAPAVAPAAKPDPAAAEKPGAKCPPPKGASAKARAACRKAAQEAGSLTQ